MSKKSLCLVLAFAVVFGGGIFFGRWNLAIAKGHEAFHGGVLNVIGEEAGHAEIRFDGDVVEVWFVGGGNDTDRAVPIQADKLNLIVEKELILEASPLVLAGETKDNCSHFTARAPWLASAGDFTARGKIHFKGRESELLIQYPDGYDPHHGGEEHGRVH